MNFAIRIVGRADGEPSTFDGKFIVEFHDTGRRGVLIVADELQGARLFHSKDAALHFWRQQSKRRPLLPDGRPNQPSRPLSSRSGDCRDPHVCRRLDLDSESGCSRAPVTPALASLTHLPSRAVQRVRPSGGVQENPMSTHQSRSQIGRRFVLTNRPAHSKAYERLMGLLFVLCAIGVALGVLYWASFYAE
jgi:hypothetical protein